MQTHLEKSEYERLVTLAGKVAIFVATLLIVVKLLAWLATGSSSIFAALTDSFLDVTTSSINLLAIKIALKPANEEYRFGQGKAESLAGLAQAAFISGSAVFLIFNGIFSIVNSHQISETLVGVWVMLFSLFITLFLVLFQNYIVKKTGSMAIKADAIHYKSDLVMNLGVLAALFLSQFGLLWADGFFAILVGVYIVYGARGIALQSIESLLDKQLSKSEDELIVKLAYQIKGVRGIHDLRTRQSGNIKFIQLHLELDDEQSLLEAHYKGDELEEKLKINFPNADILIHLDPLSIIPIEKLNQKLMFEVPPNNTTESNT